MSSGARRLHSPGDRVGTGPLALSVFGTVLLFVALAILGSALAQHIAESEAESSAGAKAAVMARVALAPFLVDGVLERDPEALAPLGAAAHRLIAEGQAIHIKVWSTAGQVLWADSAIAGATFDLGTDERRFSGTDEFTFEVGHLDNDKNLVDGSSGERVLEVYLGSYTRPSNTPVLVETYYSYSVVSERARELRSAFLPILIGGLALLAAAQIPLTVGLARRLERYQQDRERLLNDVIDTRDIERQRIAAQVHDGALQDLIGVSFELSGAAAGAPADLRPELDALGIEMRRSIRSLRSILNSIYPVAPMADGWASGLESLADALRSRGVDVEINIPDYELSPGQQEVILRTASEAMRNAMSHARCQSLLVQLYRDVDCLRLVVRDDGCGFSTDTALSQRKAGHLGLQLISDLATAVGAVLTVESDVGAGTEVRLDVSERVMGRA